MVRHGESEWNEKNLFCGWFDANLSEKGKQEAINAGKALKDAGYKFDVAFTSVLTRAQVTLQSILKEIGQENIPIVKTWRLNERHYGGLTGLNKAETAAKYGDEQVRKYLRPAQNEFPMFESLKLTIERTLPFWNDKIVPEIKAGKSILIAAHGNSLRGIVKHLDRKLIFTISIAAYFCKQTSLFDVAILLTKESIWFNRLQHSMPVIQGRFPS
nr:unnamed protein product [Callosobruchus analis]